MKVIHARNVNDAYAQALPMLSTLGVRRPSRAGDVTELDCPVTTVYENPEQCVLWDSKRDCNPFFHLFESLWMLAGHNDITYLTHFNARMQQFSDDGFHQHGAYGYRWRHWFGYDQLEKLILGLKKDKMSRREIVCMWSPMGDQVPADSGVGGATSKDLPCNVIVMFSTRRGVVDMTVCNRSNDIIFGCYGANAVHFSFLLQYVAASLRMPIGRYYQVSNNWHAYDSVWQEKVRPDLTVDRDEYQPVTANGETTYGHIVVGLWASKDVEEPKTLRDDIREFVNDGPAHQAPPDYYTCEFLDNVASPMRDVWREWKAKNRDRAIVLLEQAEEYYDAPVDWFVAARKWMQRRMA